MRQRDENYLSMARSVQEALNRHKDKWSGMPRFAKGKKELDRLVAVIMDQHAGSQIVTRGATEDKADAKDAAIALATKLGDRAQVYAQDKGSKELWQQLEVSETRLGNVADSDALALLRSLLSRLEVLGSALVEYGVSQADYGQLKEAIAKYEVEMSGPRDLAVQRKGHNASLMVLLQDLRTNFRVLDRLINLWEDSDLEKDYWNARIVVDYGHRRAQQDEGV